MTDDPFDSDGEDLDDVDADEPVEITEGTGRVAARLPDGSGFLVIEGPGAGTVVADSGDAAVREAAPLPDRDAALDGTMPLFLVHRSHRHWRALPRLLATAHALGGGGVAVGTVSKLAAASEDSHREFHQLCGAAAVRIVDPDACHATPGDLRLETPSQRRLGRAPYLGGHDATVAEVLEMQRTRGANLLLTPGRALDPADPQGSLDAACADGDDALAELRPGERLALNLVMSGQWLSRDPLRRALLDQLNDQEQFDTWYVRVQWPGSLRTQMQPVDEALLRGYRRLAELAADEDRRLLLPQTGLTGWFMLAFGTAGFGTGTGGSEQSFREEAGGGGGGASRIERYFERQLLHAIERTDRPTLMTDPDYLPCECPYCPALLRGPGWSEEYESLHQLWNSAALTAAVAPASAGRGGTHAAVRRAVRDAVAFASDKALGGLSDPRHLQVWDRVV